jgi:hypothetical protein
MRVPVRGPQPPTSARDPARRDRSRQAKGRASNRLRVCQASLGSRGESIIVVRDSEHRGPGRQVTHIPREPTHFLCAFAPVLGIIDRGRGHRSRRLCFGIRRVPAPHFAFRLQREQPAIPAITIALQTGMMMAEVSNMQEC